LEAMGYDPIHPDILAQQTNTAGADVEAQPFDGIEVYHPKNKGRYDEFTALAEDRRLLISGGSDFHGTAGRFPEELGIFTVPAEKVTNLLEYEGTCKACKP